MRNKFLLVPYPSGAMNNGFNSGCSASTSPLEQLGISLNSQSGLNLGIDVAQSSSAPNNAAASVLAALAQSNRKFKKVNRLFLHVIQSIAFYSFVQSVDVTSASWFFSCRQP